ncbi:adenosine kinase [Chytriomyces sp. MP71]|nr:adenosine kinase [Chytriomyces sp. MP71]
MHSSSLFPILVIGQPLLDISARVNAKLLKRYGLNANDMVLATPEHQTLYKELQENGSNVTYLAGGSCQNSARGAQWLLPANSTCYIGVVGKDDAAKKLREAANADGLRVEFVEDRTLPTGKCAVLITGQDRSMVTDLQASATISAGTLENEGVWQLVQNSRIIYTVGFMLKGSSDAVLKVARHATETGKVFAFNLSAPFIPEVFKAELAEVIPHSSFLFGNESEARAYARSVNLKTNSIRDIALHLAKLSKADSSLPNRTVVITQGPDPVIVATPSGVREFVVPHVAARFIVDSNGAGDGFCGGFLAALTLEKSLRICVRSGLFVAGEVLKQEGATYPKGPCVRPWDDWSFQGGCCALQ